MVFNPVMYMKRSIFYLFAIVFLTSGAFAQETESTTQEPVDRGPNNLREQFDELKTTSNTYENYKVIRINKLDQFWSNVQDSLFKSRQELLSAKERVQQVEVQLDDIDEQLEETQSSLESSEFESNRINVLGLYVLKESYMKVVWGIIGALILVLAVILIKFRVNNRVTTQKKKDYEELSDEFNEYRKLVRDREIKIKRELQTERNKLEELRRKQASHK